MNEQFFEIGINHLSTPLHFRESLAHGGQSLEETIDALRAETGLDQLVLLSTCSRFEVFACSSQPELARERVRAWLRRRGGAKIDSYLNNLCGPDAVAHLFRVAAGLESWILGESEILSQVKKAYQAALSRGCTGATLNRVFQSAIAAGKLVRAETGIQDGIHSIGGAAAVLARSIFGAERRGKVVVFGAGEAAEAVCRHLAAKNFGDILVANRTIERARELAGKVGGEGVAFDEGLKKMADYEIAVFSASSPAPFIERAWVETQLAGRRQPLFLIDLGMPRNVAADCAKAPGVYLYDLDDLKGVVEKSMEGKAGAKRAAEVIVDAAAAECLAQLEKSRMLRTLAREVPA